MGTRIPWGRVVELAEQLEAVRIAHHEIDPVIAERVARAVLDFQEQLLGDHPVTVPTPAPERELPGAATPGVPTPSPPHAWARVVELARQFESLRVTRGETDVATATNLARAVLDFQERLRNDALVSGVRDS